MVDNLLPDLVGLPHVLDLAVHLVQQMTWMGRGGETMRLFPFRTLSLEHSFMVKSYGWWVVAHGILVSPPVPIGLRFGFWTALGLGLGLGGLDLGLGLDNWDDG